MVKNFFKSALAILFLNSCASYNASALCDPSPNIIQNSKEVDGITVVSKAYTKEECQKFLDRDVIAEGYIPVQIYIRNDSDKSYIFSIDRISLPAARSEEVAKKVHTSTVGRIVGYGVGSLFVWPLLIPAIVDGVMSYEANQALDNDFASKVASDRVVFPHSRLNTIIFVPSNAFQNSFTVTLVDQTSNHPKKFTLQG